MSFNHYRHWVLLVTLLSPAFTQKSVQAQSITTADTATTIQQTGNQYQIDGGNLSGDSTTLFHSFNQFSLLTGESAQFSNPDTVETIIGRVGGGSVSLIDGLLAVDGTADLYLLNPAGVLFGENAQLNLNGDFSASTATGLTFADGLFDVWDTNDYSLLNGSPTGYVFSSDQVGAVVNEGNLTVGTEQSLTLLGGQVINTGQLSAPDGEILVMAVPGENLVRLSQPGSLLTLELETWSGEATQPLSEFTAATIPTLLTGASELGMATELVVNPDGTVSVAGSSLQIPLENGTTVVSGQLDSQGGNIGILGDQIALVDTIVDASGPTGGGTVLIGGDQLGNGSVPNATVTIIDSNSVVRADAQTVGDGGKIVAWGTDALRMAGQLSARGGVNGGDGGFIETSSLSVLEVGTAPDVSAVEGVGGLWLLDPTNIRIVAGDGATNISDTDPFDITDANALEALLGVDLILDALTGGANVEIRTTGSEPGDGNITLETALDYDGTGENSLSLIASGEIEIFDDIFDSNDADTDALDLILLADGQITVNGDIATNGGNVLITSNQAGVDTLEIFTNPDPNFIKDGGEITIVANNDISTGLLSTRGRDIYIESFEGSIDIGERVFTSSTQAIEAVDAGDVVLVALEGEITVAGFIQAGTTRGNGDGGDVIIDALGPVTVGDVLTSASPDTILLPNNMFETVIDSNASGSVFIQSGISIAIGDSRNTTSGGTSGIVVLTTPGDIEFNSIDTSSTDGVGGEVFVLSELGNVQGFGFTLADEDSTIFTDGLIAGGAVTITHGGGTETAFSVIDSTINGTEGAISTGTVFLIEEEFLGSAVIGDVQILTTDLPPIDPPVMPPIDPPVIPPINPPVEPPINPEPEDPFVEVREQVAACIADCSVAVDDASDTAQTTAIGTGVNLSDPDFALQRFEEKLTTEFVDYLSDGLATDDELSSQNNQSASEEISQFNTATLSTVQTNLLQVQGQTGQRPALIYAVFGSTGETSEESDVLQTATMADPLELMLVTSEGDPKYVRLPITRGEVIRLANRFRRQVSTPSRVNTKTYLKPAQELYQVLIAPLEAELEAQGIDTISFITDAGLRSIPLAALHDGENFIIQNYNVGLMPSLSLTDLTYKDLTDVSALVAGTSAFVDQVSLPGVPVELEAISSKWSSTLLKEDTFNLNQLQSERRQRPYGIIHLATHGEFNVGDLSESYLHLHNQKLALDQLRTIGLHQPAVELLTLSACQTALGSRTAELGFAGFAVLAGAKTSVASLWNVSDEASAGLMIEFYRQLQDNQPIIKADALRRAQLAMLEGNITIENDQLKGVVESQQLPADLTIEGQRDFSHPYYWAAFSLVGSPW